MTALILALSFISCLTVGLSVFMAKRMLAWMEIAVGYQRELLDTKRKLAVKIAELENERIKNTSVAYVPFAVSVRETISTVLDDRTKALVRLAVSNPEKQEGESAAMIVCKRIKEKIDG